ncbi:MAG: hypothetical protein ACR2FY_09815 [Pirellulaceae bacterium]
MRMQLLAVVLVVSTMRSAARSEGLTLHTFERRRLSEVYFSEGANAGDSWRNSGGMG